MIRWKVWSTTDGAPEVSLDGLDAVAHDVAPPADDEPPAVEHQVGDEDRREPAKLTP